MKDKSGQLWMNFAGWAATFVTHSGFAHMLSVFQRGLLV